MHSFYIHENKEHESLSFYNIILEPIKSPCTINLNCANKN